MRKYLFIILFLITLNSFTQNTCTDLPNVTCNQFNESFEPINLNEAISYLECIWGKNDLEKLKTYESQDEKTKNYVRKKIFCTKQKLPLSGLNTQLIQFFWKKLPDLLPEEIGDIIFNQ